MTKFLGTVCPALVTTAFHYLPVTFWRSAEDMWTANLASNGLSDVDPAAAIPGAAVLYEFDEALLRYVVVAVELAGGLTAKQFGDCYARRSRLTGSEDTLTGREWIHLHAPDLMLGPQRLLHRVDRSIGSATGDEVMR